MSPESHKALLRQMIACFNAGDWNGYFRPYAEDVQIHGFPPMPVSGLAALHQFYSAFDAAFADSHLQIEDIIAEGDRIAVRYTFQATHIGPFMDIPASNRGIKVGGMTIFRMVNGQIVERWQQLDDLGLLQQLGAIPAPDTAARNQANHDPAFVTRTIYDLFSRSAFDRVLDYLDDDIEAVLVPYGQTFRGKAGFADFMRGFKAAFPDLVITVTNQFTSGDHVTSEFTAHGTHTGPLHTPGGVVPPTGLTADFTVCEVVTVRDGKVTRLVNYQDAAGLMRQLGLLPEPVSA